MLDLYTDRVLDERNAVRSPSVTVVQEDLVWPRGSEAGSLVPCGFFSLHQRSNPCKIHGKNSGLFAQLSRFWRGVNCTSVTSSPRIDAKQTLISSHMAARDINSFLQMLRATGVENEHRRRRANQSGRRTIQSHASSIRQMSCSGIWSPGIEIAAELSKNGGERRSGQL
jgi:hypothetical protein